MCVYGGGGGGYSRELINRGTAIIRGNTAISRKVVGKSAREATRQSPKGIVGGFEFTVLQRQLIEWHERP